MLVFLLGSAAVALAFAPVMISSSKNPSMVSTNARNVTQPVHVVCSISMSALCLYFVIKKNTWKSSGRVKFIERKPQRVNSSRSSYNSFNGQISNSVSPQHQTIPFLQMVVFGVGACLWLTFSILNDIYTIGRSYEHVISSSDKFIYMISIVFHMAFLAKYAGAILPNSSLFHYSIALMIADKVWVWLTVTLSDLVHVSQQLSGNSSLYPIHPIGNCCNLTTLNTSSETMFFKVVDVCMIFLEPFFIEFLTISIGVLFNLWHLIGNDQRSCEMEEQHRSVEQDTTAETLNSVGRLQDYGCLINESWSKTRPTQGYFTSDMPESERHSLLAGDQKNVREMPCKRDSLIMRIYTACVIFFVLGFFAAEFILLHGQFHYLAHELSDDAQYFLYRCTEVIAYGPVTVAALPAIYKIYQKNACSSIVFSSSDYLLFFTATTHYIWFILKLIAAATVLEISSEEYLHGQAKFSLIFSISCILQVWIQTQFIVAAQSVRRFRNPISKLTRMCLIYITVINVSEWLRMAISRGTVTRDNFYYTFYIPILSDCFGEVTTRTLMFLFYPALELFRFHSAIVAYEVLK